MIQLKEYIKELKIIEKNINASEEVTNTYAWVCALETKLHSLDNFLENQKAIYYKAMVRNKLDKT
jgi:hypothetical protein